MKKNRRLRAGYVGRLIAENDIEVLECCATALPEAHSRQEDVLVGPAQKEYTTVGDIT